MFERFLRHLDGRRALLRFKAEAWRSMIGELGARGGGRRESGAFLLAARTGDRREVAHVVYLDDLDPACLIGGIAFSRRGYGRLGDLCAAEALRVIGDVHTHPGDWVCQSSIDQENPMLARPGHVALIVPHFAQGPVAPASVGMHRYDGEHGWSSWCRGDAKLRLYVGRWW